MKHTLFYAWLLCLICMNLKAQNYVTLYTDCDFGGQSQMFKIGRYPLGGTRIGNASLSSFRIPQGFKIIVYNSYQPGEGPEKMSYTADTKCLRSSGWNDKANSMVVEKINDNGNNDYGNNNNTDYYNGNYSNSNLVTLYSDCNYRGTSKFFREGRYSMRELGVGDDRLSSIRVPPGWSITIYQDPDQQGGSMRYASDISCLPGGWDNKTSSIMVQRGNNNYSDNNNYSNSNLVTLYSDCNYRGTSKFFREGRYSMRALGVGDDRLSSIRVPSGWSITIYQDPDQQGGSMRYTSDISCLPGGWDNKTSSIMVQHGNNNYSNNNNNNYPNSNLVTLYSDCNFRGTSKFFREGRYSMNELGVGDDELSSIRIPPGWVITIYQDPNQRGGFMNYSADVICLPRAWNNKTSSIWIKRSF